jgi:Raf kinase inhibitor-like YbhB/YbcL family protein
MSFKRVQPLFLFLVLFIFLLLLSACSPNEDEPTDTQSAAEPTEPAELSEQPAAETTPFTLTSPAITEGQPIPQQYTCDGDNISPELNWQGIPAGTATLALIMDDPDAPGRTWVHWVLFNIPAEITSLPEAVVAAEVGTPGRSSGALREYSGPCPPTGVHRYFFKLYALDTTLDLDAGATAAELTAAMEGHILAEAQLMGTYER